MSHTAAVHWGTWVVYLDRKDHILHEILREGSQSAAEENTSLQDIQDIGLPYSKKAVATPLYRDISPPHASPFLLLSVRQATRASALCADQTLLSRSHPSQLVICPGARLTGLTKTR